MEEVNFVLLSLHLFKKKGALGIHKNELRYDYDHCFRTF